MLKTLYLRLDELVDRSPFVYYINAFYQKHALKEYDSGVASLINSPVFIVGAPHSGTSVMLAILGNHSEIYAVPKESYLFFGTIRKKLLLIRQWNRETLTHNKRRWAEKTPRHTLKLKDIFRYYPNARVILMLRDGRDVACSVRDRTGDLEIGIKWWLDHNQAAESFQSDPKVLKVKYEELVKHTETILPQIFSFLNQSYEPGVEDTTNKPRKWYSDQIARPGQQSGEFHGQYRNWQINQPLFDGSGKWLKGFSKSDITIFKQKAGHKLIEYGYERDLEW